MGTLIHTLMGEDQKVSDGGVVQALEAVVDTSTRSAKGSRETRRAVEGRWIRARLESTNNKRSAAERRRRLLQLSASCQDDGTNDSHQTREDHVGTLGALQLRRILRAVGLSTDGLRAELAARVREVVSSGDLASFVKERRAIPSQQQSFECVAQLRKANSVLSLMENLLSDSGTASLSSNADDSTTTTAVTTTIISSATIDTTSTSRSMGNITGKVVEPTSSMPSSANTSSIPSKSQHPTTPKAACKAWLTTPPTAPISTTPTATTTPSTTCTSPATTPKHLPAKTSVMYVDKEERTPPSGGIPAVDLHTSADCPAPQHASPGLFTVENTRASETNTASDISAIETKAKPTVLARWPPAAGLSTASAGESFAGQKEAISKHAPESSKKTEVVPKNGGARAGRPELASVTVGQDSITDAAADSAGSTKSIKMKRLGTSTTTPSLSSANILPRKAKEPSKMLPPSSETSITTEASAGNKPVTASPPSETISPTSQQQRWGPPEAAPLLKSVSSCSSPPITPSLNKSNSTTVKGVTPTRVAMTAIEVGSSVATTTSHIKLMMKASSPGSCSSTTVLSSSSSAPSSPSSASSSSAPSSPSASLSSSSLSSSSPSSSSDESDDSGHSATTKPRWDRRLPRASPVLKKSNTSLIKTKRTGIVAALVASFSAPSPPLSTSSSSSKKKMATTVGCTTIAALKKTKTKTGNITTVLKSKAKGEIPSADLVSTTTTATNLEVPQKTRCTTIAAPKKNKTKNGNITTVLKSKAKGEIQRANLVSATTTTTNLEVPQKTGCTTIAALKKTKTKTGNTTTVLKSKAKGEIPRAALVSATTTTTNLEVPQKTNETAPSSKAINPPAICINNGLTNGSVYSSSSSAVGTLRVPSSVVLEASKTAISEVCPVGSSIVDGATNSSNTRSPKTKPTLATKASDPALAPKFPRNGQEPTAEKFGATSTTSSPSPPPLPARPFKRQVTKGPPTLPPSLKSQNPLLPRKVLPSALRTPFSSVKPVAAVTLKTAGAYISPPALAAPFTPVALVTSVPSVSSVPSVPSVPVVPSVPRSGTNRSAGVGPILKKKVLLSGGVNISGVVRAVSPSRLPAPEEDDDSDEDNFFADIVSSSAVPPVASCSPHKAVVPKGADLMAAMSKVAKPFKGKNIQVIFDVDGGDIDSDNDSEEDDEYCIRSGSDSGSDEETNDLVLRKLEPPVIPAWAESEAMAEALERQYGGDKPVNPNSIFVDFYTCSLENIFDTKKKKWNRRSTGDWNTDRLTIAEKLAYDRIMGYTTIGSTTGNNSPTRQNE